jgi:hypothetical protein
MKASTYMIFLGSAACAAALCLSGEAEANYRVLPSFGCPVTTSWSTDTYRCGLPTGSELEGTTLAVLEVDLWCANWSNGGANAIAYRDSWTHSGLYWTSGTSPAAGSGAAQIFLDPTVINWGSIWDYRYLSVHATNGQYNTSGVWFGGVYLSDAPLFP